MAPAFRLSLLSSIYVFVFKLFLLMKHLMSFRKKNLHESFPPRIAANLVDHLSRKFCGDRWEVILLVDICRNRYSWRFEASLLLGQHRENNEFTYLIADRPLTFTHIIILPGNMQIWSIYKRGCNTSRNCTRFSAQ